jgi:chorismate dehydratase
MLRIGRIDYANCTPVFHALQANFPCDGYSFVGGVPARLNSLLAAGEIDVCPSSSFEYAVNSEKYLILPDLSISSTGAVASVLLFSRIPIEELNGETVLLSSESATSVNLLKILLKVRYGCRCDFRATDHSIGEALRHAPALLLIGDAALRASQAADGLQVYDMGMLWNDWTGTPFVFALWLATRSAAERHAEEMRLLTGRLQQAKTIAMETIEQIARTSPDAGWMGVAQLIDYWRHNISYDLTERHLDGLRLYFSHAAKIGLIEKAPDLCFFE